MAKYIDVGDTIEGNSIYFMVRKWTFRGLKKHPITDKTMTLYVSDKNSTAEIMESRPEPEDDDLKSKTAHFHREIGDILQADALSIFIANKRKITPKVDEGASHRHGAQFVATKDHTISEIKVPHNGFKKLLGYSSNQIGK